MRIRNQRDFWSGVLFIVVGSGFTLLSMGYDLGTLSRMGPGAFPAALGALLAVLGLVVAVGALARRAAITRLPPLRLRELLLVLGAVAVFAGVVGSLGLVLSAVLMLLISSLASHELRFGQTLVAVLLLVGLSYLVFVQGLGLQIPTWPTGFGRV